MLQTKRLFFLIMLFFAAVEPAWAKTPQIVGEMRTYTAQEEDTLAALARKHNIGYVEMLAANQGIDPWLPGAGTEITLPMRHIVPEGPHEGLVINLGTMRLFYYREPDGVPETFAIGIGREGKETPLGETTITKKVEHPVWYPTASTRADKPELPAAVGPGPDNPLGAYALYLGWASYLIHGTNDERGVGRQASRGCMRMYDKGIEELYQTVLVGTKVTVVNQPVQFAKSKGELFVSVFPSRVQADELEDHNSFTHEAPPDFIKMVLAAAGPDANRLDWDAVRQAANDRKAYPVQITK